MNSDNVVIDKSLKFAIRIVRLYQYLCSESKEFVMSKQLLRCGTSIGSNINEAQYAVSKGDFLNKMYISLKECAETMYWITLLYQTDYLSQSQYDSLLRDCSELRNLLSSITKSTRDSMQ